MTTITLVAALFSLALTLFVVWANPYRFSNQVFALVLLVQTAWLGCVYRVMQIGLSPTPQNSGVELEWWVRTNAAVIPFLPAPRWLLKCAITMEKNGKLKALTESIPLFALGLMSVGLCSTQSFVSRDAFGLPYRGPAYYVDCTIGVIVYAVFMTETFCKIRLHNGI